MTFLSENARPLKTPEPPPESTTVLDHPPTALYGEGREARKAMKIYHNPRCSKSRRTLALLKERGHEPEVVRYLETGLAVAEIRELAARLGLSLHDLLRSKEPAYREQNLSPDSSDEAILQALVAAPILLERPVVVVGEQARTGRPPEAVLELLDGEGA